jgi:hypothetical protein
MIEDEIWEVYGSPGANSITVIHHEGNAPRLCTGTPHVSHRKKISSLHELLQRFLGTKYVTSEILLTYLFN